MPRRRSSADGATRVSASRPRVVLAGGSGFLGTALAADLATAGYEVVNLTRTPRTGPGVVQDLRWDGRTLGPWVEVVDGAAAVVNLTGRTWIAGTPRPTAGRSSSRAPVRWRRSAARFAAAFDRRRRGCRRARLPSTVADRGRREISLLPLPHRIHDVARRLSGDIHTSVAAILSEPVPEQAAGPYVHAPSKVTFPEGSGGVHARSDGA